MWIPVVFVLIALAVLLLAFWGVFGRFPDNWEWVGIVLAGVSLAMASPSILQRFCGRPLVKVEFGRAVAGNERLLLVYLQNLPIRNRVLRKLGVRRDTVQSLTAHFRISEFGSNKVIDPIRNARIYSYDDPTDMGKWQVVLAPTFSTGASFGVVSWDTQKNKAFIPPDRTKQSSELLSGYYRADIIIVVDGEPKHISQQFAVDQKADDLIWAGLTN